MNARDEGPRSIGDSLRELVARFTRVNLEVMNDVRTRWPQLAGEAIAARCEPEVVKDGILYVRVPTGAFAEALRRATPRILEGLSDLGPHAPTQVRAVVGDVTNRPS
jgi:predicted nucleic acid-binding Zn ribbon protein